MLSNYIYNPQRLYAFAQNHETDYNTATRPANARTNPGTTPLLPAPATTTLGAAVAAVIPVPFPALVVHCAAAVPVHTAPPCVVAAAAPDPPADAPPAPARPQPPGAQLGTATGAPAVAIGRTVTGTAEVIVAPVEAQPLPGAEQTHVLGNM